MNEMEKLIYLLTSANIPYEVRSHWSGTVQVYYPSVANKICDAVCFPGSYGYEQGFLEIMGLVNEEKIGDTVEGWLDAIEVYARMKNHYDSTK